MLSQNLMNFSRHIIYGLRLSCIKFVYNILENNISLSIVCMAFIRYIGLFWRCKGINMIKPKIIFL